MSATITVDVSEVLKKIDPQELERVMTVTMHEAGKIVLAEVKRYPSQKSSGPMHWKSLKQRMWFFAALREGRIEVPYRRGQSPGSQKLGASWNVRTEDKGMTAIIGTRVSYAPYVVDKDRQAQIHQGNWQTVQESAEKVKEEVGRLIRDSLRRWAK